MSPGHAGDNVLKQDKGFGPQPLNGRSALVTGASEGIGRAIAVAFGALGATVVVADRRRELLDETVVSVSRAFGADGTDGAGGAIGKCIPHVLDLTDDKAVAGLVQFVDQTCQGQLAFLVHSAESVASVSAEDTPLPCFDTLFSTNMRAPFLITRGLLPLLRAARGDIAFVNSLGSLTPRADAAVYAASKAALRAFADCLRAEINADGVRVLSVFPGRTASPMHGEIQAHGKRDDRPEQLLEPDTVANAIIGALRMPRTAEVTELFVRPANRL